MSEKKNAALMDYNGIFSVYEIKWDYGDSKKRDTTKKYLKRALEKCYPGRKWDELSEPEKELFIYVHIAKYMIDECVPSHKENRIREKIKAHVSGVWLNAANDIYRKKSLRSRYFYDKPAFDAMADDNKKAKAKKDAYKQFTEAMREFSPDTPVPSLEEWAADNEEAPKNINDYELRHILSHEAVEPTPVKTESKASQADIDHVLLMTIVKILREQKIAYIDVEKIERCLTFINTFHECPIHPLMLQYDPDLETGRGGNLKMTREEQEGYIKRCRDYLHYMGMLDNLSFYEVFIKNKPSKG